MTQTKLEGKDLRALEDLIRESKSVSFTIRDGYVVIVFERNSGRFYHWPVQAQNEVNNVTSTK